MKMIFAPVHDIPLQLVTVQTGCYVTRYRLQSIHLREKNIAYPTESLKMHMHF